MIKNKQTVVSLKLVITEYAYNINVLNSLSLSFSLSFSPSLTNTQVFCEKLRGQLLFLNVVRQLLCLVYTGSVYQVVRPRYRKESFFSEGVLLKTSLSDRSVIGFSRPIQQVKVQFSSVQSFDRLRRRGGGGGVGGMVDSAAQILFLSFLQETIVSSSGMDRDAHSLTRCLSSISSADRGVVHLPRCPEGWFWPERLSWRVTCPNHASGMIQAWFGQVEEITIKT